MTRLLATGIVELGTHDRTLAIARQVQSPAAEVASRGSQDAGAYLHPRRRRRFVVEHADEARAHQSTSIALVRAHGHTPAIVSYRHEQTGLVSSLANHAVSHLNPGVGDVLEHACLATS
jgi:hypothetical protein